MKTHYLKQSRYTVFKKGTTPDIRVCSEGDITSQPPPRCRGHEEVEKKETILSHKLLHFELSQVVVQQNL